MIALFKPKRDADAITASDVVDAFRKSPAGKELLAKRRAEALKERKRLAGEVTNLHANREKEAPILRAAVVEAEKVAEAAKQALTEAFDALGKVRGTEYGASINADVAEAALLQKLRETSDPAITEAIAHCHDEIAITRRNSSLVRWSEHKGFSLATGYPVIAERSNGPHLAARMDALNAAIARLRQLEVEAVEDVDAAIATILSTVPSLHTPAAPAAA